MTFLNPIEEAAAEGKAAQAFTRIKDVLSVDEVPEIFRWMGNVPPFVHDFFMNFRKFVLTDTKLPEKQKLLIAIAVAGHAGSRTWLDYLRTLATDRGVADQEIMDVLAIGATNSMYNVLFKFRDIAGTSVFEGMPVGLRAHTFQSTTLDDQTVELVNLALSDINACKPCTAAHVKKAQQENAADEAIYETIQCAATMVAGSQFLTSIGLP